MNVKRQNHETLDDYLNRFKQLKSRCYTNILEHELVKIAATGLDFSIRKKLVNEQLRDMAQLAEKIRRIEQIKLGKERLKKFDRVWVNQISRVIPKFNSVVFDSPTEEMKGHFKPLLLTLMIEGHEVNKVLVDGGATVNILLRTMLKRFGKSTADLKPHNILISDYAGKSSHPEGMILLNVQIGSMKRTTMFIVTPSKANFNVLLGREWIHGVGVVP
uniref:Retrotransposon gag domain-containing protein n=1 Tax=Cajanus cajan TaxID=3821 RepID=A0A151RFH2_CAJCA|nr:hypothetical protein KK1_037326 [Cajanus cajan]